MLPKQLVQITTDEADRASTVHSVNFEWVSSRCRACSKTMMTLCNATWYRAKSNKLERGFEQYRIRA